MPAAGELERHTRSPFEGSEGEEEGQQEVLVGGGKTQRSKQLRPCARLAATPAPARLSACAPRAPRQRRLPPAPALRFRLRSPAPRPASCASPAGSCAAWRSTRSLLLGRPRARLGRASAPTPGRRSSRGRLPEPARSLLRMTPGAGVAARRAHGRSCLLL
jgi:hypothetical protein